MLKNVYSITEPVNIFVEQRDWFSKDPSAKLATKIVCCDFLHRRSGARGAFLQKK